MRRQTTSEYERDDALPESLDAAFSDEDIEENEVVPLDFDADSDYEYADRLDAETLEDLGIDYSPRDWE
ncbi:MAG TPA: hypothetical protein HPP77_08755 [Candidatus Hydrogenedentes bacterium]|nr:hypothetical protein [Candidatus Hydrogenedentota bacterium]